MKITYYGQNGFGIETKGHHLLTDPFITGNDLAKDKVDINKIKAEYLLLTHAHQDHILDAEAIAKNTGAVIVAPFELANHFGKKDLEVKPVNQGGSNDFGFFKVKVVKAVHSSSLPDGSYGGNPVGFIFTIEGKNIYMAGDTALTLDMKLIPEWFNIDLAILPIGDNFTMGIKDAITASDFVKCDTVIGCHYDTFPPIAIDHTHAKSQFKLAKKELVLMEIGESMEF